MSTGAIDHAVDPRPEGAVHTVTVVRPEKLNALSGSLAAALSATLDRIAADDEARLVVLRGTGDRAWVGGADIREMATLDADSAETFIRTLQGVCGRLRELPVPVIAVIHGWCLGAGLELAACCDLRLASREARFGMPEVRVGLPSVIEEAVLPRLVGAGRARDLVLTGRVIDADEALSFGLLDGLATGGELETLVDARVGEILAGAPAAIRRQKVLCRIWEEQPLADAVEAGVQAFRETYTGDEPRRYLGRFLGTRDDGS